jgi:hypothetical protein
MSLTEIETRYLAEWNADFVPWPDEIATDDDTAMMTERAFEKLPDYSFTIPSGAYPGKRWKTRRGGQWWMREFGEAEGDQIKIINRKIIFISAAKPRNG